MYSGRRRWLARLTTRVGRETARQDPAWRAEVETELRRRLGADLSFVWRPAAPGLSRATLGWIGRQGRLIALARGAEEAHHDFLDRHDRGLAALKPWPQLDASVPRILVRFEAAQRAWLIESACTGRTRPGLQLATARWLGRWQRLSVHSDAIAARAWRRRLQTAMEDHHGLCPGARRRLLQRLEATPDPPLVAAHGDFWPGNILISGRYGAAASVVDWSEFQLQQHPFHDAGFYLLTCGRGACGGVHCPPGQWLRRAFAPGARFRRRAEAWFHPYRTAVGPVLSPSLEFSDLLDYLPLTMAHYACFGQQAEAWTAAANAWGEDTGLTTRICED